MTLSGSIIVKCQAVQPCKDARLVFGAMLIKHKSNLSDEETVQQIQENPYIQFVVGLSSFTEEQSFAPGLFVEFRQTRKRRNRVPTGTGLVRDI